MVFAFAGDLTTTKFLATLAILVNKVGQFSISVSGPLFAMANSHSGFTHRCVQNTPFSTPEYRTGFHLGFHGGLPRNNMYFEV